MNFLPTAVDGCYLLELECKEDDRGFFARTFCAREFADAGLEPPTAQTNLSYSRRAGTVRGLHYQELPAGEAKLVRAVRGALFDVVVDLRPGSSTYLRHVTAELNDEKRQALYVPQGCAHGFQTLQEGTEALYQVSEFYAPHAETGVRYDDPAFAIEWPLPVTAISDKDASWPDFQELR